MVTLVASRLPSSAIVPEKITVHAFSALGFTCLLLFFSAAVYSVKRNDLLLNRFNPSIVQTNLHDRPHQSDYRNVEKLPEEGHEEPPPPQQPEKGHEATPQIFNRAEEPRDMKHMNNSEKFRDVTNTHKTKAWQHSDDIRKLWKRMTAFPRVLRCENISCLSKARLRNMQSPGLNSTALACPVYFQWIYEDLAPWVEHGISLEMLDKAKHAASFRVIISDGRLFVEPYHSCFQTRSLFTIWGLLQLLEYYPGLVPDVDLMFACEDRPVVKKKAAEIPIPVFRYCSAHGFWDIPFPDWSFWGWSEINIPPWDKELANILEGSIKTKWATRNPFAYWKGNPAVAKLREQLLTCNSSQYGAQIYAQDWFRESNAGFKDSKLADQCDHRYKIYAEGTGWSVSLKYLLACNSPLLLISPEYHDFFSRGLEPKVSYWPVRQRNLCESIKFAVEWGNSNPAQAEKIGKAGQEFIATQVNMKLVYDYMLHILTQYAALLRYKPGEVVTGMEVCSAEILCSAQDVEKVHMQQSKVTAASSVAPCRLAPHEPGTVKQLLKKRTLRIREIESWEDQAIANQA